MKKRTKAGQKRLNNLLLILLLSAVLLIMSTYAWFTANRTVNVDAINLFVATSSGLQISANGEDWKTVLTYLDIKNAYTKYTAAVNQLPKNLAPVSSRCELDDAGHLKMFYGNINTDLTPPPVPKPDDYIDTYGKYLLTTKLQTDVNTEWATDGSDITTPVGDDYAAGYYFAFDLFLKDTAGADNLYMSGSITEDGSAGKGLENAARIAIVQGECTPDADTPASVRALKTKAGTVSLWEPNCEAHTDKGIQNGKDLGWIPESSTTASFTTVADAIAYDGVNKEVTDVELSVAKASHSTGGFTAMTPTWKTLKTDVKPSLEMKKTVSGKALGAGATKFRVYMWIEGQDIDCQNYASGTDLKYDLTFSLDAYEGEKYEPVLTSPY